MARYEIDIPASTSTGFAIKAHVEASTWSEALRLSLGKLEGLTSVQSLIVDILDDQSMRVTEPNSQRTYHLKQLLDAQPRVAAPDPGAEFAAFLTPPPPPSDANEETPPIPLVAAPKPVPPPISAPLAAQAPTPITVAPVIAPLPLATPEAKPAAVLPRTPSIPTLEAASSAPPSFHPGAALHNSLAVSTGAHTAISRTRAPSEQGTRSEEVLATLFERCQEVYTRARGVEDAAEFYMDLAMEHVPSEAGAVFISEINRGDIYFAAARGPRAEQVRALKIPLGQGFIGFAVDNGVGIAVSDVERDPRAQDTVAQKVGYPMRSLICSPAQKEGRVFGGIEVFNKANGARFEPLELEIMNYLGDRFAEYLEQFYAQKV